MLIPRVIYPVSHYSIDHSYPFFLNPLYHFGSIKATCNLTFRCQFLCLYLSLDLMRYSHNQAANCAFEKSYRASWATFFGPLLSINHSVLMSQQSFQLTPVLPTTRLVI